MIAKECCGCHIPIRDDSSCFRDTKLYQHLRAIANNLYENGFFIIGDSAYCIESFLLTPYDNAVPKSPQDDYNFFHSSARITVECAFGEIDLRWGIFWKRLNYSLDNISIIVEGAMRLHNYLVDYRESFTAEEDHVGDMELFRQDAIDSQTLPLQTGNDLGRLRGNISNDERMNRYKGEFVRSRLMNEIRDCDMHRPRKKEWYCDTLSHVQRVTSTNE